MDYNVDLRDVKFQLFNWLATEEMLGKEPFAEWDRENIELVLDEALKIAQQELAPVNEEGDREGALWSEGRVTMPCALRSPYRTIAEGGWIGAINNPELGGLGLPHVVGTSVSELFAGANVALTLVFMLTRGASELIEHFGTEELRQRFCRKLYSGEWTGTMCLTEPHAGSDVGASTTKALPQEDGSYLLSGEKIFITYGDHDLTDNIVHLVLARVPGAPSGTRGLSLFVVPKFRVTPEGRVGEPNDVHCASIEHKMGIHASPTCSILFGPNGACQGYLLGEENVGIKLMFRMMNSARLEVGLQAQAVAGAAYQAALAFAKERVQSRHWTRMADHDAPPVAIVEHPDVRRMLLTASAYVQGMRALLLRTASYLDRADHGEEKERFAGYVQVLTPICKAWASDWAFRVTEWCLQVFGGYGYTRDYPAEQHLRDTKIASIYEGTNGIQALDLVGRKLSAQGGAPLRDLLGNAAAAAKRLMDHDRLAGAARQLGEALREVQELATEVPTRSEGPLLLMLNAVPFLDMLGTTLVGSFLLEQAAIASDLLADLLARKDVDPQNHKAYGELLRNDQEAAFLHNKIESAAHFAFRALPNVKAQGAAIRCGDLAPVRVVLS